MVENSINFISRQTSSKHSFFQKLAPKTRIGIFFLIAVVVAGLGAYGIKTFFDSQTEATITGMRDLGVKRSISTEDSILQLPDQVKSTEALFKKHFYATSIFRFFRQNTLKQIQIMTAVFDRSAGLLTFTAQANTFDTLAAQLLFLRSKSEVKGIKISGIQLLETGKVTFQMSLTLAESIITTP